MYNHDMLLCLAQIFTRITYDDGKDAPVTVIRAGGLSGNVTCIERFDEITAFRQY